MAVFLDAIAPVAKAQPRGAGIAGQLRLGVPGMARFRFYTCS
jgi:hypothetical protein